MFWNKQTHTLQFYLYKQLDITLQKNPQMIDLVFDIAHLTAPM